ncbi:hypothetical protein [Streptomyces caelestis]|uniref:hypothetical protein n=1 Tax=Streptomyces caelestis TaxID=36816 RepID=UPI00366394AF
MSDDGSPNSHSVRIRNQRGHGLGVSLEPRVSGPDLGDQVSGRGLAGQLGRADGSDRLQRLLGFGRGQVAWYTTEQKGAQQRVRLVAVRSGGTERR